METPPDLVEVAGAGWPTEETFQAGKHETALDQYQVREHSAWYRHLAARRI